MRLVLGVTRIGHGIRAAEDDPALMADLAARMPSRLEVCPELQHRPEGGCRAQAAHPAKTLYHAGIKR
jgi:adenosine deaminase